MQSWLKLVILVILGGCQCIEKHDTVSRIEDNTYDSWAKPKGKKLFEIKIKQLPKCRMFFCQNAEKLIGDRAH